MQVAAPYCILISSLTFSWWGIPERGFLPEILNIEKLVKSLISLS